MDRTLEYYSDNADKFIEGTVKADFGAVCDRFLKFLPEDAYILDFGCGSGRDTKYFLGKGCLVDAVDGSPELCEYAGAFTGIPVHCMLFQELDENEKYDGVWACASILHVRRTELPDVFDRMTRALKPGGHIYASFKYGDFEGERNGRYFSDFAEKSFDEFVRQFPELSIADTWISGDVRPGRGEEKWLNIILSRSISR